MTFPWRAVDLTRFHRGDADVFRRLIAEYSPRLLALTNSYARDLDDAHDLLQDTWYRVYRKRRGYSGHGTFLGWVSSLCRNVCIDAVAKRTSRDRLIDSNVANLSEAYVPTTDADANRRELRQSIRLALLELPPRERDVVVMRLLEGRSVRDTARRLKCAEGTVKATLHHALKKMRSSMEVWAR